LPKRGIIPPYKREELLLSMVTAMMGSERFGLSKWLKGIWEGQAEGIRKKTIVRTLGGRGSR